LKSSKSVEEERWSRCHSKGSPSPTTSSWRATTPVSTGKLFEDDFRDPLEAKYYKDYGRVWKREMVELVPLQQVRIAQCDHQQLEDYDAILDREALQGGFGGPLKPIGQHSSGSRDKMESAPLQKVRVAQALEVHWSREATGKESLRFKRH